MRLFSALRLIRCLIRKAGLVTDLLYREAHKLELRELLDFLEKTEPPVLPANEESLAPLDVTEPKESQGELETLVNEDLLVSLAPLDHLVVPELRENLADLFLDVTVLLELKETLDEMETLETLYVHFTEYITLFYSSASLMMISIKIQLCS